MISSKHKEQSPESGFSLHSSFAIEYPPELPISERRDEIIDAIREHQVVIVTGETGSGKSTQIPKMCLGAGRGSRRLIGCTQPRRIAAVTLAERVADELGSSGRRLVGYKIRFQDRTTRHTRVKFMTDGILLAEAQRDRLFRAYDTIIVDEAHERTLNIDFLLGLIKKILPRRPDLKVVITSATIDPEKFSRAFDDAPIIEVSGRMYPVDVWHRPLEPVDEEDETTYVDQAVAAADALKAHLGKTGRGDILVFMPTESDIREMAQRLEERRYRNTVVLPLFGRMAAADQQRIFQPTVEEKIIIATNVAETSITIPGIRFVIDTGLARISQYNARSRTQSLPVLPVSRASADQRKGRCGRVKAGVCIRLYSEEDYLNRVLYTPPEIQRSNLAEVILRMLYLRLGNIQDFPFLDPPSPAAVKDGFGVLKELGAVDDHRKLTRLGHLMARLPIDPRLSRMLIEARKEGALRELMILTAALSVQDPRERPMDKEAQADQAHAPFKDPRSDFVMLLKIWEASFLGEKSESRSKLRKFCRERYLSYRRMREWRDIHDEIEDLLAEMGDFPDVFDPGATAQQAKSEGEAGRDANASSLPPAGYDAIHRSILSGYLSHIGMRKEKNNYLAAKNRQAMIFPGSGLFNKGGSWIVASELVQTSRLYARIVASIQPEWIEELGRHLCRYSYFEPHWEKKAGQVVAFERATLYGLTIVDRRKVNYARINPGEARQIFIRSALVEGDLPNGFAFMEHNRRLIERIEELESKARRRDLLVDDETIYRFYDERLPEFSDIRSFRKFIKDQGGDTHLRMTEADLLKAKPDRDSLDEFPDVLKIDDMELPLRYAFKPGEDDDGVTAVIPVHALHRVSSEPFEWLVPGLLLQKVTGMLKTLPKSLRRQFVPVGETAQRLFERLPFMEGRLSEQMSRCAHELTGAKVPPDEWSAEDLPLHLKVRFEVVGPDGNVLGGGRNLDELRPLAIGRHDDRLWDEARKRWEREGITTWDFGSLPHEIEIGQDSLGLSRFAYPGLVAEGDNVAVRLFDNSKEARRESLKGLMILYQHALSTELRQLMKNWAFPEAVTSMIFFMGSRKDASLMLQNYLMRELFGLQRPQWPEMEEFEERVRSLTGKMGSLALDMVEEALEVVRERDVTRSALQRFQQMAAGDRAVLSRLELLFGEMEELAPGDFLDKYERERIRELPRYLKALRIRGERAYVSPEKDRLKSEQLAPYGKRFEELKAAASSDDASSCLVEEFRQLLEEYKISLFSPEMKTRLRVSPKRLEEKWQEWISLKGAAL